MADHLLLYIDVAVNDNVNRFRFFVKIFPETTYPVMKKYIQQSNLFNKEIFVYNILMPRLKATFAATDIFDAIPQCFYARNNMLILEDLSHKGYQMCTLEHFNETHIKLTLETVASLHAISIAYEETISRTSKKHYSLVNEFPEELKDGINRNGEDFTGYWYLQAAHKGLLRALDFLPTTTDFKGQLNEAFHDIFEILNVHKTYQNVFSHGDLWPMNILFQYEHNVPKSCKLVDFQLMRYTPPAHDVLYFLLHILKTKNLENYLHFYYTKLSQHLKCYEFDLNVILPLKEFHSTCNLLLPPLKLKHTYQAMLHYANSTYMQDIYKNGELYKKCLFEDRSEMVEHMLLTDDGYREVVRGLLEELQDVMERKMSGSNYLFQ